MNGLDRRFAVAPMMDWTDRHCRAFHRVLSKRAVLYSEMVTAQAVLFGDRDKLLGFDADPGPTALQLGGNDPEKLARAAAIGVAYGYHEVNLNCGCPSDRVQDGAFGACLMRDPVRVAQCMAAIAQACPPGVLASVKHRLGVDEQDEAQTVFGFVETLAAAGIGCFIVHARKAWLAGLSPKENRDIPPLNYPLVAQLKAAFPQLTIILNGGIETLDQAQPLLEQVDGVMLGRAAYHTPALLGEVDRRIYQQDSPDVTAHAAVAAYRPYLAQKLAQGVPLHAMTRHMLGLFHGVPGGRTWRRILTVEGVKKGAGLEVLDAALSAVRWRGPEGLVQQEA